MPEYLAPGVYVEEVDTGSKPIEGVSTSTAGMVGVTERGPVNVPMLITSYGEYQRRFGGVLNPLDFPSHCFLPHAVEGFFTNGGKRAYITRALPAEANPAERNLFDRGTSQSASTVLLRAAPENSGSAITPPLLYVLDSQNLAANDSIRVGDGSRAEYRQVTNIGVPANNTQVPVNFPLSYAHNAGAAINQINRVVDVAYPNAPFSLVDASVAGSRTLLLSGDPADVAKLVAKLNAVPPVSQLFEIGTANSGEYRFCVEVTDLGGNPDKPAEHLARIRLDSDLEMAYATGPVVTPLDIGADVIQGAILTLPSSAGEQMVFVDDRNGQFNVPADLAVIDAGASQEVRRIGELDQLILAWGAYETYPVRSLVEDINLTDDDRTIAAPPPAAGESRITLTDVAGLGAGQEVTITNGVLSDSVIIDSVDTANSQITLRTPLVNAYAGDANVRLTAKHLTAAVKAGDKIIALDNRLGLAVQDVIRIGTAPEEEFVTIADIDGERGAAPDAGRIVLTRQLSRSHATNAEIRRLNPPSPAVAGRQPALLILAAGIGAAEIWVNDGHGYAAGDFIRVTLPSGGKYYHRLAVDAAAAAPVEVTLDSALAMTHETGAPVVERMQLMVVQALDAGAWGNRLRVSVEDEPSGLASNAQIVSVTNRSQIRLSSLTGVEPGTVLEILGPQQTDGAVGEPVKVRTIDRTANNLVNLSPGLSLSQIAAHNAALAEGQRLRLRSCEFRLTIYLMRSPDPAVPTRSDTAQDSETFRYLSLDPRHSRYIEKIIGTTWAEGASEDDASPPRPLRREDRRSEGESQYVRVYDLGKDTVGAGEPENTLYGIRLGPEALVDIISPGRSRPARHLLEGGNDSLATLSDNTYIGDDAPEPEGRTGLHSFQNIEDISLIAIPGQLTSNIQQALIDQCNSMRYRFAVLDGPQPPSDSLNDVQVQRQQYDTKYAALYHPWLMIPHPFPTNLADIPEYPIPPSGHMLGIYARTDIDRGVHKAPANEVVRGILGLRRLLNKAEQDILNPSPVNINVIRDFRNNNRGIRVYGGRVITSDPDWKYVNVRRLLIYLEHSIDRGLQWVVFEPNAEPLWARVRRTISNFLTTVWRNGALEGTTKEEAFFVKCDRTTMMQTDIDNGKLICVIGVAPVKPAEYVIIRIGLWTAHAED
jgi:Bacteriophage tail sheath protein